MKNKSMQELLDELIFMIEHDKNSKTQYVIRNKKKFWKIISEIGELADENKGLGEWGKDY